MGLNNKYCIKKICNHEKSTLSMFFSGLGCGWCYDKSNPTKGQCMSGSFNTTSSATCPQGEWAYAKCPDIDECQLGNYYN